MSDPTTYPNPAALSEAVRAAMDAGDVAELCKAIGDEAYAKGFEAGRRAERSTALRLLALLTIPPGRGDAPVSAEPSPSSSNSEAHAA